MQLCFTQILQGSAYCQIWAKLLNDGSYAVGLYNAVSHVDMLACRYQRQSSFSCTVLQGSRSHDITLEFQLLNFSRPASVRDLWAHKDLGTFNTRYMSSTLFYVH